MNRKFVCRASRRHCVFRVAGAGAPPKIQRRPPSRSRPSRTRPTPPPTLTIAGAQAVDDAAGQDRAAPGSGRSAAGCARSGQGAAWPRPRRRGRAARNSPTRKPASASSRRVSIQFDAGYVGFPDGDELRGTVGGLNLPEPRLEHPRPPICVRRRRHAARAASATRPSSTSPRARSTMRTSSSPTTSRSRR